MDKDKIRNRFRLYRQEIAVLSQSIADIENALADTRWQAETAQHAASNARHDAAMVRERADDEHRMAETRRLTVRQLVREAENACGPFACSDRQSALRRLRNM